MCTCSSTRTRYRDSEPIMFHTAIVYCVLFGEAEMTNSIVLGLKIGVKYQYPNPYPTIWSAFQDNFTSPEKSWPKSHWITNRSCCFAFCTWFSLSIFICRKQDKRIGHTLYNLGCPTFIYMIYIHWHILK